MRNPKMRVLFQTPISSTSRSNPACTVTPTLKKSNLLKSISSSSSSLLTTSDESSNDSQSLHRQESVSAPVSRQSSDVLDEKKTVMWNEDTMFHIQNDSGLDLKSATRTKSEPNLSRILIDEDLDDTVDELKSDCIGLIDETTPIIANKTKSITRKLIKGVSMGNLRFPFTPENTKRLLKSATSGRSRSQEERSYLFINEDESDGFSMENRDIIATKLNDASTETEEDEEQEYQSVYKYNSHLDLLTSTPSSFLFGRRSMSPITKSTQRMSKAMQVGFSLLSCFYIYVL